MWKSIRNPYEIHKQTQGEPTEDPWRIHSEAMGNHGNTYAIHGGAHMESMGIHREATGNSMEVHIEHRV